MTVEIDAGEEQELGRLSKTQVVEAPLDGPLERQEEPLPSPYYTSVEEVFPDIAATDPSASGEFAKTGEASLEVDRRNFMRLFGASATLSATAACVKRPEETAVPYVNQPIDSVPGVSTWYASTCGGCASGCGVVVKTREGRPVKLEGNPEHPMSQGALCSLGQGMIQGLYHPERRDEAYRVADGAKTALKWNQVWKELGKKVSGGQKVGILTGGASGHRHQFMADFLEAVGSSRDHLYTYEADGSYAASAAAHKMAFGQEGIPRPLLHEARLVVGVGADIIGGGVAPTFMEKGYSEFHAYSKRKQSAGRHVQFESDLTKTGGASDERYVIRPGHDLTTTLLLVKSLLEQSKTQGTEQEKSWIRKTIVDHKAALDSAYEKTGVKKSVFDQLAKDMLATPSVLFAGDSAVSADSTNIQLAAIMVNILVGAYKRILMFHEGWFRSPVKTGDMARFLRDAEKLDVLFVIETDPVHTLPQSVGVEGLLKKIGTVVSVQSMPASTDVHADLLLPSHHYLESWGDESPVEGFWSFRQPTVRPTKDTRQAEDILLWVAAAAGRGIDAEDYRAWLMKRWERLHSEANVPLDYEIFSKGVLRRGFWGRMQKRNLPQMKQFRIDLIPAVSGLKLLTPMDHRLHDGRGAHLPVLQEVGDSMSTIAWDTWVGMNPHTMKEMNLRRNQIVVVQGPGGKVEAAAFPMPGLHREAVVIPRGNGAENPDSTIAHRNGVNPLALVARDGDTVTGDPVTTGSRVTIEGTDRWYRLAAMQKHNNIANRTDVLKKMSLNKANQVSRKSVDLDDVPDLFPPLEKAQYHWGMSIDLDRCTGCNACMVACSIENNVPQVGREQILLGREMHWIRMDRYYYGSVDHPVVSFQPVMCQHCNHAPCEAVCPVFATTHDPEGINAMTYNRCVGTRYCANACPYKVRRFNWWTHKWGEMGERPQDRNPRAMNPDVTVRTRGVMEKCNFCVGRLRDAKHKAKREGRQLRDGEALVACQQTCPSEAITFGNLNDKTSRVSQQRKDSRAYLMLGGDPEHGHYGLKTLPNVSYLAAVEREEPLTAYEEYKHYGYAPHHGSDDKKHNDKEHH
ncbi:MAG: 4Fe-4S dicluster domain-containing protein [Oligoflexales bacterium]